jgi:hypothetical protein
MLQVPRKLGLFGCSRLMPDPYALNPALPAAFAEAVCTLLDTALRYSRQAQMGSLTTALLQQATESGLLKCIDQLAEATAQQLQHTSAQTASALSTLSPDEQAGLEMLQYTASVLLATQVCCCCGIQSLWRHHSPAYCNRCCFCTYALAARHAPPTRAVSWVHAFQRKGLK